MPEPDPDTKKTETTTYDVFISVAAMASITIVIWLFMIDPKSEEAKLLNYFDYFFCLIFFIDYLRQLFRAKKKFRYIFGWGIFDLASSIPHRKSHQNRSSHSIHSNTDPGLPK